MRNGSVFIKALLGLLLLVPRDVGAARVQDHLGDPLANWSALAVQSSGGETILTATLGDPNGPTGDHARFSYYRHIFCYKDSAGKTNVILNDQIPLPLGQITGKPGTNWSWKLTDALSDDMVLFQVCAGKENEWESCSFMPAVVSDGTVRPLPVSPVAGPSATVEILAESAAGVPGQYLTARVAGMPNASRVWFIQTGNGPRSILGVGSRNGSVWTMQVNLPAGAQVAAVASDRYGYSSTSEFLVVAGNPAGAGEDRSFEVDIFPNPAVGKDPVISIDAPLGDPVELEIFDQAGRLVHSAKLIGTGQAMIYRWNTSGVAPGIYTVVTTSSGSGRRENRVAVIN